MLVKLTIGLPNYKTVLVVVQWKPLNMITGQCNRQLNAITFQTSHLQDYCIKIIG